MYHPMLSLAVAQTRIDDMVRDAQSRRPRVQPGPDEEYAANAGRHLARLTQRLARYAARRTRPSAA